MSRPPRPPSDLAIAPSHLTGRPVGRAVRQAVGEPAFEPVGCWLAFFLAVAIVAGWALVAPQQARQTLDRILASAGDVLVGDDQLPAPSPSPPPGLDVYVPGTASTGRITVRLDDVEIPEALTRVIVEGKAKPKLDRASTTVQLAGWECARVEPSGAVVVDLLCCSWESAGPRGRFRLVERADLAPAARRECRARNGAKP